MPMQIDSVPFFCARQACRDLSIIPHRNAKNKSKNEIFRGFFRDFFHPKKVRKNTEKNVEKGLTFQKWCGIMHEHKTKESAPMGAAHCYGNTLFDQPEVG